MIRRSFYLIVTIVVAAVTLQSCGDNHQSTMRSVVVGIPPVWELARSIAGDSIEVSCLLPRGGNPETYEPTLSQIAQAEKAKAFLFVNITGFEAEIAQRLQSTSGVKLINVSAGVELLYGSHEGCNHHHHNGESCNHQHEADPHVWSSARNARIIASNILTTFIEIDKGNAQYYRRNYDNLVAQIDSIDSLLTQKLTPHKGEAFIVWHPSLGYFARDYSLEQVSVGGLENKETSVKQLIERLQDAGQRSARVFVSQQSYDTRQAQVLNKQLDATIVEIDPLSPDWAHQLILVADAFASE